MSRSEYPIRQYISKSDDKFKCNAPNCNYTTSLTSITHMKIHLYYKHEIPLPEDKLIWDQDEDEVWRDFTKEDLFLAKCKTCHIEIIVHSKTNLSLHLKSKTHVRNVMRQEFESTPSSLWDHFTSENDITECIHCGWWVYAAQTTDSIIDHLIKCEYSKYSESSGKTETVNEMVQQSGGNYPSTSSHQDNPQPAPRNEEERMEVSLETTREFECQRDFPNSPDANLPLNLVIDEESKESSTNQQEAPRFEDLTDDEKYWHKTKKFKK